ncbi:MAG: ABC transporter permease, partial [Anaerolineae bacterium]|nr:ABC transporter permease [Anaerolineae bacterium]
MTTYLIRRSIQSLLLLFVISMLIYVILNLVPGGPFDLLRQSNPRITQSMIDRLNALLDLDKPLLPGQYCPATTASGEVSPCRFDQGRYFRWLGRVFRGDFGTSWTMQTGTPVLEMIGQRVWYTFLLMSLSTLLAVLFAIPIGIYSAVKQYSAADYFVTGLAFFGQSMPTFWTGLMAVAIFAVGLHFFPTGGVHSVNTQGDIIEAMAYLLSFGRKHPEMAGKAGAAVLDGLHHV